VMAVEVTTNEHPQASAGATAGLLRQLQRDTVGHNDIVTTDHGLSFDAEDLLEVDPAQRHKRRARVRWGPLELGIEGRQELVAEIAIGGGHGGDAGDAQFVDQAVLLGGASGTRCGGYVRDVKCSGA